MMDYLAKYDFWKKHATDKSVVDSLTAMQGNDEAIKNAFHGELKFGTAGLRGIMTAGTDRMNVYTVFRATEGLAQYMLAHNFGSCAITYDSRLNSWLFCQTSASALAYHGIKVYVTKECMPTPFLSFMVRDLQCDVGINITASHNPSEYNGYKVYDSYGCQLTDEACEEVTGYISNIDPFCRPLDNFDDYLGKNIFYVAQNVEQKYKDNVIAQSLNDASGVSVVYTPLNGAGYRIVPEVLRNVGLTDLVIVAEQSMPDGNFPTCSYPNPEKHEALTYAINLAKSNGADIVIANDPDCDRLGIAVKCKDDFVILSGNEVGVLLTDYILSRLQQQNALPANPILVKTIVTTIMVNAIAKDFGAEVRDVLTGFKYIGNVIAKLESQGTPQRYVFGFEESCGYLKGTYVRDKDGVVASMLVAQMASYYKKLGKTLEDQLNYLYDKHGSFYQQTISYRFDGVSGAERKNQLLQSLRTNPITYLGNSKVVSTCDFLTQTLYDLPKADVLRYNSMDGSQLIIRPSGTEPLIKCYITVQGDKEGNKARFAGIKQLIDELFS